MRFRPEARVGLIVLIAVTALGGIYFFFGRWRFQSSLYHVKAVFTDVLRLSKQAEVRMAGVRIGDVEDIRLNRDRRAEVTLSISRLYSGKIPEDSEARITTGGLTGVGDYYVEILPGSSTESVEPGGYLRTQAIPKLDDLMKQFGEIVGGLKSSITSVNELLQNPKTRKAMDDIIENARLSTEQTAELTKEVREMVKSNRPEMEQLIANTNKAAEDFAAASQEVRNALEHGGVKNIQDTLASAAKASENLEATTDRLRKLAEDPQIESDLRQTLTSAKEAAQGTAEIVGKVQKVIGKKTKEPGATPRKPVPGQGVRFDMFSKTGGDFRIDFNYTFPAGGDDFYRLGLVDLGEGTNLTAQFGRTLDQKSAFRYGLYASRLGVGYDRKLSSKLNLQMDFYRPNDPKLETKLRYDFSNNWGAWLGTEDLFGGGQGLIGVQYRK